MLKTHYSIFLSIIPLNKFNFFFSKLSFFLNYIINNLNLFLNYNKHKHIFYLILVL